jgi:saccharopine dehydrogenase-like NADP-dependent oxidoreductase
MDLGMSIVNDEFAVIICDRFAGIRILVLMTFDQDRYLLKLKALKRDLSLLKITD